MEIKRTASLLKFLYHFLKYSLSESGSFFVLKNKSIVDLSELEERSFSKLKETCEKTVNTFLPSLFLLILKEWVWILVLVLKSESARALAGRELPGSERVMAWERKQETNLKEKRRIMTLFWLGFFDLLLMFHLIVKPSEAGSQALRTVAVTPSQSKLQLGVLLC